MQGTYNPYEEGAETDACLLCLPGYTCAGEGNSAMEVENQCPKGHYCLEGSQQAIPCPPGTYALTELLGDESGCVPCPGKIFVTRSREKVLLQIRCKIEGLGYLKTALTFYGVQV